MRSEELTLRPYGTRTHTDESCSRAPRRRNLFTADNLRQIRKLYWIADVSPPYKKEKTLSRTNRSTKPIFVLRQDYKNLGLRTYVRDPESVFSCGIGYLWVIGQGGGKSPSCALSVKFIEIFLKKSPIAL